MITRPSSSSRRIRLGLPTSSLPSGVTVAALRPKRASRMAAAASDTTALDVARRCSSERSKRTSSRLDPGHVGVQHPHRLVEQLLARLVAFQDDDAQTGHGG